MAKTIKFNLICDGYPCRTLDDLREHFSVEDILDHFKSGLLKKWLNVRGYQEEERAVDMIDYFSFLNYSNREIISKLVQILGVEEDQNTLDHGAYIFDYYESQHAKAVDNSNRKAGEIKTVDMYFSGYARQVANIFNHRQEMGLIKAALKIITDEYRSLFELDYTRLFTLLLYHAPMAIFGALMNPVMREYLIPVKAEKSEETEPFLGAETSDKNAIILESSYPAHSALMNEIETLTKHFNIQVEGWLPGSVGDLLNTVQKYFWVNQKIIFDKIESIVKDQLYEVLGAELKMCNNNNGEQIPLWNEDHPSCMILKITGNGLIIPGEKDASAGLSRKDIEDAFPIIEKPKYNSMDKNSVVFYLEV